MSEGASNIESSGVDEQTQEADGVSFLDLLIVLSKHKKIVLGVPFAAAVVTAIISLIATPIFTGTTKMLPPQQSQSAAMSVLGQLGSQLGGIAGLAGGAALGIRNANDMYVGMLKSRTVADNLLTQFKLREIYDVKYSDDARRLLAAATSIVSSRDGIITIEVEDKDPKRAAEMANAYVEELYKLTQTVAVTEASQRRMFFERELGQAKTKLADAEGVARQKLEKGGLVIVDAQGRGMVETTTKLRAQMSVKEIQINAMRSFATDQNPDLQQAQHELDAMKKELARIEGDTSGGKSTDAAGKPVGMENLNLLRNVRYYEIMYELLAKQYELARIDESKDAPLIQVLDKALVPERRTRPKRTLMVILATLVAGIVSIFLALLKEYVDTLRATPARAKKLDALIHSVRYWRQ